MTKRKHIDKFYSKNKPTSPPEILQSQIHIEINKNKIDIDKSIFNKTEGEKLVLKKYKKEYKQAVKEGIRKKI